MIRLAEEQAWAPFGLQTSHASPTSHPTSAILPPLNRATASPSFFLMETVPLVKKPLWLGLLLALLLSACQPPTPAGISVTETGPAVAAPATLSPTPSPAPSPVYPPLKIAYTDQGKLWVWENGLPQALTRASPSSRLTFSSDGGQIAFLRDGELWAIHSDGTDERLLVDAAQMASIAPQNPERLLVFSWLPGRPLLMLSTLDGSGLGYPPRQDLALVDAGSGEMQIIFPPGAGGLAHPSPDGEWLAVVSPERTLLMKPDGSGRQVALEYPEYREGLTPYFPALWWADDSQSLLAELRTEEGGSIWRVAVDGSSALEFQAPASGLVFPPDLSHYAYVLEQGTFVDSPLELHIASRDGSEDKVYYSAVRPDYGGVTFLGWGPDSASFVYRDLQGRFVRRSLFNENTSELPAIPPTAPVATRLAWLDAEHPILVHHTLSAIWLAGPGMEARQVVAFQDPERPDLDFSRQFDVFVGPSGE